jgi:hypothetical protein
VAALGLTARYSRGIACRFLVDRRYSIYAASGENLTLDTQCRRRFLDPLQTLAPDVGDDGPCPFPDIRRL